MGLDPQGELSVQDDCSMGFLYCSNPKREHDTKMMPWQGFKMMPTQCFYEHHEHEPHSHGYVDCITALLSNMNTKAFRGGVGSRNYFRPSILCHVSNSLNPLSNYAGVI